LVHLRVGTEAEQGSYPSGGAQNVRYRPKANDPVGGQTVEPNRLARLAGPSALPRWREQLHLGHP
jgi:hypothetical protein